MKTWILATASAGAVACTSAPEAPLETGTDAVSDARPFATALVASETLKGVVGKCTVDSERPIISIPGDPAATAAIARALPPPKSLAERCAFATPDTEAFVGEDYLVRVNAFGILSITIQDHVFVSGTPHGTLKDTQHTFDLSNGARIGLSDVLERGSAKKVTEQCTAVMGTGPEQQAFCATQFAITKTGVRGFETSPFGSFGEIVPWSALRIKKGPLARFKQAADAPRVPSDACKREASLVCGGFSGTSVVDECLVDPRGVHQCVDEHDNEVAER